MCITQTNTCTFNLLTLKWIKNVFDIRSDNTAARDKHSNIMLIEIIHTKSSFTSS